MCFHRVLVSIEYIVCAVYSTPYVGLTTGSGDAVSITVNINGALSQPVALVSYATPVVTQLSAPKCTLSAFDRRLLDCPTDQAIDLTISGSNFGRPTYSAA